MECVRLGETGLKISRLALGCMSYGGPATPPGPALRESGNILRSWVRDVVAGC